MKTAIIIHGMPSKESYFDITKDSQSNSHFIPWIQNQLVVNNILAQTPEMPTPYLPDYESWKKEFERFDINENTILVGHSCGAGFIIRYLSENNVKVNKVALVAPWINVNYEEDINFFDFEIDKNLLEKVKYIKIFSSKDDTEDIINSIKKIKEEIINIESKIVEFENRGHFTFGDMKTREFPELLEYLIS
ncbi:MAG: alpha/beta hydrolase [Candidatus Pacebacteria bacterium]|nr:alpha/beta hydrolase [Candidatus Paceibacterota bacterium]